MRAVIITFTVVLSLAWAGDALSCQFDTDCDVGSKCVKQRGQIHGICAGGQRPGNRYDKEPVYDPLDPNDTVGDTCQFSTDCGPGSMCLKESGNIYGVCVRER